MKLFAVNPEATRTVSAEFLVLAESAKEAKEIVEAEWDVEEAFRWDYMDDEICVGASPEVNILKLTSQPNFKEIWKHYEIFPEKLNLFDVQEAIDYLLEANGESMEELRIKMIEQNNGQMDFPLESG